VDEESHPNKKLKLLLTILFKKDSNFDDVEDSKPFFKCKPKVLGRVQEWAKDLQETSPIVPARGVSFHATSAKFSS